MCITLLAPQLTMTTPVVRAARYEGCSFKPAEHTEDRKRPLNMKWVMVTDEHGNRKLRIDWTVASSFLPATVGKGMWPCVEPALGGRCVSMPNPQARVAIR
jgi:hypothetical protein